jgi:catechol 2,3-dioxygenase-like lactoylglutathione lyase family enzyme
MNVEHVGIYARDSVALAEWYAKALGLREIRRIEREDRPPVVFLTGEDGAVVEILPTDAMPTKRDLHCPGFTHLGIVVSDLDAEERRLAGLGIELWGVRATSNGWKIGYLRDPEGNVLELVQR